MSLRCVLNQISCADSVKGDTQQLVLDGVSSSPFQETRPACFFEPQPSSASRSQLRGSVCDATGTDKNTFGAMADNKTTPRSSCFATKLRRHVWSNELAALPACVCVCVCDAHPSTQSTLFDGEVVWVHGLKHVHHTQYFTLRRVEYTVAHSQGRHSIKQQTKPSLQEGLSNPHVAMVGRGGFSLETDEDVVASTVRHSNAIQEDDAAIVPLPITQVLHRWSHSRRRTTQREDLAAGKLVRHRIFGGAHEAEVLQRKPRRGTHTKVGQSACVLVVVGRVCRIGPRRVPRSKLAVQWHTGRPLVRQRLQRWSKQSEASQHGAFWSPHRLAV